MSARDRSLFQRMEEQVSHKNTGVLDNIKSHVSLRIINLNLNQSTWLCDWFFFQQRLVASELQGSWVQLGLGFYLLRTTWREIRTSCRGPLQRGNCLNRSWKPIWVGRRAKVKGV